MAWEREYSHMNIPEHEHTIGLIDRSAADKNGNPARYLVKFKMGAPKFGAEVLGHMIYVKLGGELEIQPDGTVKDADGKVFDTKAFEKEIVAGLERHHELLRAYGRRHGAQELKAKK